MTTPEIDWPWMEVSRERLEQTRRALISAGVEATVDANREGDSPDPRVEWWWGGVSLVGYRRASGAYFLHPNFMEPEEKVGLTAPEGVLAPESYEVMLTTLKSSSGSQFIAMMTVAVRDFGGDSQRMFAALEDAAQRENVVAALNAAYAQGRAILDRTVFSESGSPAFEELAAKYRDRQS